MKKIFVSIIALSISLLTLAQNSGDSQNSGDLKNQFYFRWGFSKPTEGFFGIPNDYLYSDRYYGHNFYLDDYTFWDHATRRGGIFELGSIFFLNSLPLADGLRLGINADYVEFSFHRLKWTDPEIYVYEETAELYKLASKVGLAISYSPVKDLVFDTYFKYKFSWVSLYRDFEITDEDSYFGLGGMGYSYGFNIRYRVLLAGFEFNTQNIILQSDIDNSDYLGEMFSDSDTKYTPLPSFSFIFGFSF